jgi:hypothetical protein
MCVITFNHIVPFSIHSIIYFGLKLQVDDHKTLDNTFDFVIYFSMFQV